MITPIMILKIVVFALFIYTCTLIYRINNVKSTSRQQIVMAMSFSSLVYMFGYIQEISVDTIDVVTWAIRIKCIGMIWFAFFSTILMLDFCKIKLKRIFRLLYSVVAMAVTASVLIDVETHHMFGFEMSSENMFTTQHHFEFMGAGYVFVVYLFLLLASTIGLSIVAVRRFHASHAVIVFSVLCLSTVVMGYLYGNGYTSGIDLCVVFSIIVIQHTFFGNKNYHFLDDGVIAQHLILDEVGDGYVVLDTKHRVLKFNQIAQMLYPELAEENEKNMMAELMFLHNHDCLEHNGKRCDIIVSELKDYGDITGYVVWLYDRTDEYNSIDELNRLSAKVKEAEKTRALYNKHMSQGMNSPIEIIRSRSLAVLSDEKVSEDIKELSSEILEGCLKIADMSKILSEYSLQPKGDDWLRFGYYDTENLIKHVIKDVSSRKGGRLEQTRVAVSGTLPSRWYGSIEAIKHVIDSVFRLSSVVSIPVNIDVDIFMEARYAEAILVFSIYLGDKGSLTDELRRVEAMQTRGDSNITKQVSYLPYDMIMRALGEVKGSIDWDVIGNDSKILVSFPQRVIGEEFFNPSDVDGLINKNAGSVEDSIQALAKKLEVIEEYSTGENTTGLVSENMAKGAVSGGTPVLSKTVSLDFSVFKNEDDKPVVLICDDNTLYLREIDSWLRKLGVKTIVTKSGAEAIEVYRKKHVDLIFMDHMMPQMDGTEALSRIRDIEAEVGNGIRVPVVLLTADDTVGARKKYLDRGFDEYISKPVEPHEIESVVKIMLPEAKTEK